jgi:hypothetical protein
MLQIHNNKESPGNLTYHIPHTRAQDLQQLQFQINYWRGGGTWKDKYQQFLSVMALQPDSPNQNHVMFPEHCE